MHATHTFGLNAATKLGIVGLDAFVLYQTGDALYDFQTTAPKLGKTKDLSAWAAQIAANANLGMATVRGAFLYTSGDDSKDDNESNAFQNVFASGAAGTSSRIFSSLRGTYYSSQMMLLFRNVVNMDSDQCAGRFHQQR